MADDPGPARLAAFLEEALAALGPKGVTADPVDIDPMVREWRGRWVGSTPVLLKPSTTEEVSAAVRLCARHGLAITPQGGNSGMVNGGVPYGEALLSLRRMNRVREVDALNDSMTLEAGVILVEAQKTAEAADRFFPLSLGAEGVATIGGLISTNAGGVAVLRYGMMRELVLGIEAVLPDGRIWNGQRGLRKDNTGYDLKQLFIGAEGTLGVVTAATLKLFPRPAVRETAWAVVANPADALALLAMGKARTGGAITGFELVSDFALGLVLKHVPGARDPLPAAQPWRVLIEVSLPRREGARDMMEDYLGAAAEAGLIADATIADTETQAGLLWKIRESIPVAERAHAKALKHDISVPVSRVPDLLGQGAALVQRLAPGADLIAFGHVGDGNIHFNVTPPPGLGPGLGEAWLEGEGLKVTDAIYDLVSELKGSISAEHGIGRLKRDELARRKSAVEMDLMRAVKRALDPDNRMNPGRVL